jgi:glutathione peroxidase
MLKVACLVLLCSFVLGTLAQAQENNGKVAPVLNFKMKGLDGKMVDLAQFQGKVVLIVNVASECGYTPQYEGLQKLYKDYAKEGLVVLGVPSNDFGAQEPGTDVEIAQFCKKNYGVEFPMLSKVKVKGNAQTPLYKYLTSKETNPKFGGAIGWNFDKFLIGRDGSIVARFPAGTEPTSDDLVNRVKKELGK